MDSRIQKMADVLVNYSMEVKPGQRVLVRGTSPLAQPLMQAVYESALKAGGLAYNYVHMSQEDFIVLSNGSTQQIESGNPMLRLMYETSDAIVRIEADEDTKSLGTFPTEKSQARQRARGEWLAIQMRREAEHTLRRCTTLFPTEAYARDAGMTMAQYEDFVYSACMV